MNDVLMPLGERYGVNVVTGLGEMSLTRCVELVDRAKASGKPVRILYISDFDPGGASMPVAVARKIEFVVRKEGHDLDIQVRPVVLRREQCIQYRLPRTPIKESEQRAGNSRTASAKVRRSSMLLRPCIPANWSASWSRRSSVTTTIPSKAHR